MIEKFLSDNTLLKKNIFANFAGNIWSGIISLMFVPLYIKFIGIEAYGLVGIFASILALSSLFDMGLSNTLNREMALLAPQQNKSQEMRDFLRTLEIPYWLIGLVISCIIIISSQYISYHWVNATKLSKETVRTAVILMGFITSFQWPISLYSGGLMGLQRQVLLNIINSLIATIRGVGALVVLWQISSTIEAFFLWQIAVSMLHTSLLAINLWRSLPKAEEKARFNIKLLLKIWRFAAGVSGISLSAIVLTQLDKIILSSLLSLEMFGYYSLALVISSTLNRIIAPIFSAVYPQMNTLIALNAVEDLSSLYHRSAQLLAVTLFPVAFTLIFFSYEILLLWTRNSQTTENTHLLVSILVFGSVLNGIMNIPYALQLASGWIKLSLYVNLISAVILVPLIIFMTSYYGVIGGACVWVILNAGYVLLAIHFMHLRLLPMEKWSWYFNDVGVPFIASLTIVGISRLIIRTELSQFTTAFYLLSTLITSLFVTMFATQTTRDWLYNLISKFKIKFTS